MNLENCSNSTSEFLDLLTGFMKSSCITVAAKLNLIDHLNKKPTSVDELAKLTKTNKNSLQRLLNALVNLNIIENIDGVHYCSTYLGESISDDHPFSLKSLSILFGYVSYRAWSNLDYSIKNDESAFEKEFGVSFEQFVHSSEEMNEHYEKSCLNLCKASLSLIDYDFSQYTSFIELGNGHCLTELFKSLKKKSNATFLTNNFEQISKILMENNLGKSCFVRKGDYTQLTCDDDFDIYLIRSIIIELDDEQLFQLFLKISSIMKNTSKIVILLFNDETFSTALLDLNFLVTINGRQRTIEQLSKIIHNANLRINCVHKYPIENLIEIK